MTTIVVYSILLIALTPPLGAYMHRVYTREGRGRVENVVYRVIGVNPDAEQSWKRYASSVLWFSAISMVFIYVVFRVQQHLPFNPDHLSAVNPYVSFNTAASFTTNTNWQTYGGETTMTYLSQMFALTFQNFLSAAVGMSVLIAMIRGFTRHQSDVVGNFWRDTVRGVGLRPAAAVGHRRRRPDEPGGGPDPLRPRLRPRDPGLQAGHRPRPGGQPDRHQAARDQRGRILQRRTPPTPSRTPRRCRTSSRAFAILWIAAALTYTFGKMVGKPAPGLGALRGDVDPDGRGHRHDRPRRAPRHARHAGRRGSPPPLRTWRARRSASVPTSPRCGR